MKEGLPQINFVTIKVIGPIRAGRKRGLPLKSKKPVIFEKNPHLPPFL